MSIQTAITQARAAYDLATNGGASIEACNAAFADLVAAKRAAETDEQKVARLNREADAHNACADRHALLASEYFDKASRRRARGELDLAENFDSRFRSHELCCIAEQAEAMRLRTEAAIITDRLGKANLLRLIPNGGGL